MLLRAVSLASHPDNCSGSSSKAWFNKMHSRLIDVLFAAALLHIMTGKRRDTSVDKVLI
jgi:hypothetical protein